MKKPLFWEMFGLLFLVGILNYFAYTYHLYWRIKEFDSLLHFLGGATLAVFFLWLYFFSGAFSPLKRDLPFFLVIAIVGSMFVAITWEIYELILGEARFAVDEYHFDTLMDLAMDTLGMMAACFYGYLKEIKPGLPVVDAKISDSQTS
ncbi:MAG TPA: hypothetical protein VJB58_02195 [Candidatus Paceibacterota bacterium]